MGKEGREEEGILGRRPKISPSLKLRESPSLEERESREHWAVMENKVRGHIVKRLKYRWLKNVDLILQIHKVEQEIVSRGVRMKPGQ